MNLAICSLFFYCASMTFKYLQKGQNSYSFLFSLHFHALELIKYRFKSIEERQVRRYMTNGYMHITLGARFVWAIHLLLQRNYIYMCTHTKLIHQWYKSAVLRDSMYYRYKNTIKWQASENTSVPGTEAMWRCLSCNDLSFILFMQSTVDSESWV